MVDRLVCVLSLHTPRRDPCQLIGWNRRHVSSTILPCTCITAATLHNLILESNVDNYYWTLRSVIPKIIVPREFVQTRQGRVTANKVGVMKKPVPWTRLMPSSDTGFPLTAHFLLCISANFPTVLTFFFITFINQPKEGALFWLLTVSFIIPEKNNCTR